MAEAMGQWIDGLGETSATLRQPGFALVQTWIEAGKWVVMIGREKIGAAKSMAAAKVKAEAELRRRMNAALAAYKRGA